MIWITERIHWEDCGASWEWGHYASIEWYYRIRK